jgi:hypothetical protein
VGFFNISIEAEIVVQPCGPLALRQAMQTLWQNQKLVAEIGRNA